MYNHLDVVARHFADDSKCQLEFTPDACPSTDGERIILPTVVNPEYADNVIGALLHETSHIKYTDFENVRKLQYSQSASACFNVLEDIRVDTLTQIEYPNSKYFYDKQIEEVLDEKKEKLQAEPKQVQVLKSLILKAQGFDPTSIYSDDVNEVAKKLEHYVEDARACDNSDDVVPLAKTLSYEVYRELNKPDNPDEENPKGDKPDGNSDEDGEDNSDGSQGGNEPGKEYGNSGAQDLKELHELADKKNKLGEDIQKARRDWDEKQKEHKNAERNARANWKKHKKAEQNNDTKTSEKFKKLSEQHYDNEKKLAQDCNELADKINESQHLHRDARYDLNDKRDSVDEIESDFACDPDADITGFKALDVGKVLDAPDTNLELDNGLADIIANKIIARRDIKIEDDNGSKINSREYQSIYTDADRLFIDEEIAQYKTHVALIFDCSGSMNGIHNSYGRGGRAFELTCILAEALQKANEGGAPVDFSIYGFACDTVRIGTLETFSRKQLANNYDANEKKIGGGTNLSRAVNKVAEDLRDDCDSDSDLVAIVITDADVSTYELTDLANHSCSHQVRFNFVAIHPYCRSTKEFKFLFGDNIIEVDDKNKDVLDKLTKIMLQFEQE